MTSKYVGDGVYLVGRYYRAQTRGSSGPAPEPTDH
jgi:hypothetical protein